MRHAIIVLLKLFLAPTAGNVVARSFVDHESLEVLQYFEQLLAKPMVTAEGSKF